MKDKKTGGRVKGSINKTTKFTRELISDLLDAEHDSVLLALNDLKIVSPDKYLTIILQLMEYCLPKLSRTELTAKDGESLPPVIFITRDEISNNATKKLKQA